MKIYLDTCCLNRPYDDQNQDRIRIETEAITLLMEHIVKDEYLMVSSETLIFEVSNTKDQTRKENMISFLHFACKIVKVNERILNRMEKLNNFGFRPLDALHIACAEYGKAELFFTTDDQLLKVSKRLDTKALNLEIKNPLQWFKDKTT